MLGLCFSFKRGFGYGRFMRGIANIVLYVIGLKMLGIVPKQRKNYIHRQLPKCLQIVTARSTNEGFGTPNETQMIQQLSLWGQRCAKSGANNEVWKTCETTVCSL